MIAMGPRQGILNRRRFIAILAAAGSAGALPRASFGLAPGALTWNGIALGAEASLTLQHHDEAQARLAVEASVAEVQRLEKIFSLHRPDSALSRLNASGRLDEAPTDLRLLLAEALRLAARSDGAFDPTIQPLWALYARHFSTPGADPEGPSEDDLVAALRLVGWQGVTLEGAGIRLARPGMALTLNGIAQGYITDRVGDLLRSRGFEHVLVDMGEPLALGPAFDGAAWRVAIADPAEAGRVLDTVPLKQGAVATSSGQGCRFDAVGRFTHILDPKTGASARRFAAVTVIAERATDADGLSTALSVASPSKAPSLLGGRARAFIVPEGSSAGRWL
jgi:thiamine biosynthesis lipoprotein